MIKDGIKYVIELVGMINDIQKRIILKRIRNYELEINGSDTFMLKKEISELERNIVLLKAKCNLIIEMSDSEKTNFIIQQPLIFIVEDDKPFNKFVEILLKLNNYTNIKSYYSGEECLENLKLKPDIIILDYDFSNSSSIAMNGLQVLKIINEKHPEAKVIMMSGVMHQDVKKAIEVRFMHCVSRYILKGRRDTSILVDTINNLTERNSYNQFYA